MKHSVGFKGLWIWWFCGLYHVAISNSITERPKLRLLKEEMEGS